MSYTPNYNGEDAALAAELWRIAQAFEEAKLLQNAQQITVANASSEIIAEASKLGIASMYLAAVHHRFAGSGQGFALYVLRIAENESMALTLIVKVGHVDFAINGSNQLTIVNNGVSTIPMAYNLIRLL